MRLIHLLLLSCLLLPLGCKKFDAPPQPELLFIENNLLPDPTAPVYLAFHEPIDFKTLKLKIVRFDANATSIEGDLLPDAEVLFTHIGINDLDQGGKGRFDDEGGRVYTMTLNTTLPIGVNLAVVIEPGLADRDGTAWQIQQILEFRYEFSCGDIEELKPTVFPADSIQFFQAEVDEPISAQLQLWGHFLVDTNTGIFSGILTNADRNTTTDCSQFGLQCDVEKEEVCRTLPEPACVEPSERIATTEEYPDYVPNFIPPTGYSFELTGCVVDQEDGSSLLANAPGDVVVQSPAVTVKGIKFNLSFKPDEQGVLRGSGSFTGSDVLLGVTSSGAGVGTVSTREVAAADAPADVPKAPPLEDAETPAP
jgi:hypothetical protein